MSTRPAPCAVGKPSPILCPFASDSARNLHFYNGILRSAGGYVADSAHRCAPAQAVGHRSRRTRSVTLVTPVHAKGHPLHLSTLAKTAGAAFLTAAIGGLASRPAVGSAWYPKLRKA